MEKQVSILKILLAFFVFGVGVIVVVFLVPGQDGSLASVPVLVSLFSLIPLYALYRSYRRKRDLLKALGARDKSEAVFWVLALFLVAMLVRIPSVVILVFLSKRRL